MKVGKHNRQSRHKKLTEKGGMKRCDLVLLLNETKSLLQGIVLPPSIYVFDSQESGTAYISKTESLAQTFQIKESEVIEFSFSSLKKLAAIIPSKELRSRLLWDVRINTNNRQKEREKRWKKDSINYLKAKA